jgi:uncharacterized membrane protein
MLSFNLSYKFIAVFLICFVINLAAFTYFLQVNYVSDEMPWGAAGFAVGVSALSLLFLGGENNKSILLKKVAIIGLLFGFVISYIILLMFSY